MSYMPTLDSDSWADLFIAGSEAAEAAIARARTAGGSEAAADVLGDALAALVERGGRAEVAGFARALADAVRR